MCVSKCLIVSVNNVVCVFFKVVNFPYPTAPDRMQLRLAEKRLEVLGILEKVEMRNRRKDDEEVNIFVLVLTEINGSINIKLFRNNPY